MSLTGRSLSLKFPLILPMFTALTTGFAQGLGAKGPWSATFGGPPDLTPYGTALPYSDTSHPAHERARRATQCRVAVRHLKQCGRGRGSRRPSVRPTADS